MGWIQQRAHNIYLVVCKVLFFPYPALLCVVYDQILVVVGSVHNSRGNRSPTSVKTHDGLGFPHREGDAILKSPVIEYRHGSLEEVIGLEDEDVKSAICGESSC